MKWIVQSYGRTVDRLARVTTSGRRIRELDGLRFLAIAVVVFQHSYQAVLRQYPPGQAPFQDLLARLLADARIGVELFFVISGFILAAPFASQHLLGGRRVSLKQYYWRRVTRLEPPYLLALALSFAVLVFYWGHSARELLPHLLASMCYLHNVIYHQFSTINSVTWSLEIEVQFYLLAPFLAAVFLIQNRALRRCVLIGAIIALEQLYKVYARHLPNAPDTLVNFLHFFLAGFLLADLYLVDWRENPRATYWADLIAIPGWLLLPFYFEQRQMLGHMIIPPTSYPFILFVLCWASFRSVLMRKFLASSFIMTVGGMCYSIYLLHLPLLNILEIHSPVPLIPAASLGWNSLIYGLIWSVPVLAVSIVYFLWVEKPCMQRDWPQRLRAYLQGQPLPPRTKIAAGNAIEDLVKVPPSATAPLSPNQPVP